LSSAAFAADMPLKAPAPVAPPTWTGFYVGGEAGYAWSNPADSWLPNDNVSSFLSAGGSPILGTLPNQQPFVSPYNVKRSGVVGGLEAGYNWQIDPRWVAGLEADLNGSNFHGSGGSTSVLISSIFGGTTTNSLNTSQNVDWYGTFRGRVGWLAAPNLLIFGTAGLAYGRVAESANHAFTSANPLGGAVSIVSPSASLVCTVNAGCYSGATSSTNVGWVAGGGIEWMFDRHWSAKIEYQLVSLGSSTVLAVAPPANAGSPGSSFNVVFKDQMNVVRAGVNYKF
jgi:outer membrane immunogenic protein